MLRTSYHAIIPQLGQSNLAISVNKTQVNYFKVHTAGRFLMFFSLLPSVSCEMFDEAKPLLAALLFGEGNRLTVQKGLIVRTDF